jgi:hypothetical protein
MSGGIKNMDNQELLVRELPQLKAGAAFAVRGIGVNGLDVVAETLTAPSPSVALQEIENRRSLLAVQVRAWVVTRL